jgi:hypothetical protein
MQRAPLPWGRLRGDVRGISCPDLPPCCGGGSWLSSQGIFWGMPARPALLSGKHHSRSGLHHLDQGRPFLRTTCGGVAALLAAKQGDSRGTRRWQHGDFRDQGWPAWC